MTPRDADASLAVETFFEAYKAVAPIGLILPDGWFGKPWDEILTLQKAELAAARRFAVDFGWQRTLAMDLVAFFVVPDLNELVLEGTNISFKTGSSERSFDEGTAKLVVSDYYRPNADPDIVQKLARWARSAST